MATVIKQLVAFLATPIPNAWLEDQTMKVYVRKGYHVINDKIHLCLDLANIAVAVQGKGTFREFVAELQRLNPYEITYMENVYSEIIFDWCERHGWTRVPDSVPPCFYLEKKNGSQGRKSERDVGRAGRALRSPRKKPARLRKCRD